MKPIKYLLVAGLLSTSALTAPALADGRMSVTTAQILQSVAAEVERINWSRSKSNFGTKQRRSVRADDDDNGSRGRRVRGWNNNDDNGSRSRRVRGWNNDDDNGRGRGGARGRNNDDDNGGGRGGGGNRNNDDD